MKVTSGSRMPTTGIGFDCARAGAATTAAAPMSSEELRAASFDHLVFAGQQHRRDLDAERLGGRQINDRIKFCRLSGAGPTTMALHDAFVFAAPQTKVCFGRRSPLRTSNRMTGFGADSGASRGDPCRRAFRPSETFPAPPTYDRPRPRCCPSRSAANGRITPESCRRRYGREAPGRRATWPAGQAPFVINFTQAPERLHLSPLRCGRAARNLRDPLSGRRRVPAS